jgi:plastocyanin
MIHAMNRALAVVPALMLALLSAACGGDTEDVPTITAPSASGSTTSAPPASISASAQGATALRVGDFSFSPRTLTVKTGTVISLRNTGRTAHTWTSKPGGPITFDVELSEPGGTATFSTSEAGTVDFVCTIHESRGMTGTLVVTA